MNSHKTASSFRSGSIQRMIAELAEAGKTKAEAYNLLRPMVMDQIEPMIFRANVSGGSRVPKPIHAQIVELRHAIGRIYNELGRSATKKFDSPDTTPDTSYDEIPDASDDSDEPDTDDEESDEIPADEPVKPVAAGKIKVRNLLAEFDFFMSEVRRIRSILESRVSAGERRLDSLGNRPANTAAVLIAAGIPARAMLHAMTMHWKKEIRHEMEIEDFDFVALSKSIMDERGIDPTGKHEMFGYILVLVENRVETMLVGPAGTGKSYLCKQIARYLNLPYGETPITAGATRGDLLGRMTANPQKWFILAKFPELYANGGIFNFEELDAGDARMLLVLNNALSSDTLYNSSNGSDYPKHADFCAMATANTFGTGATQEYTGRDKLDFATLDRFRMGRVWVALDETLEAHIATTRFQAAVNAQ